MPCQKPMVVPSTIRGAADMFSIQPTRTTWCFPPSYALNEGFKTYQGWCTDFHTTRSCKRTCNIGASCLIWIALQTLTIKGPMPLLACKAAQVHCHHVCHLPLLNAPNGVHFAAMIYTVSNRYIGPYQATCDRALHKGILYTLGPTYSTW